MTKLLCLALVLALSGCSVSKRDNAPPVNQVAINLAMSVAATFGCSYIPPQSRADALSALQKIDAVAAGDLSLAYAELIRLADQPGLAQLWHVIHSQLDAQYELTPAAWTIAAQQALRSAISGCRAGIPREV